MNNPYEQFWQYISDNSAAFIRNFPAYTPEITRLLILSLVSEESIGTGMGTKGKKEWAEITMNEYDGDRRLSLRYHPDKTYDLFFMYYNDDKEDWEEISHNFSSEEAADLPAGLRLLLEETLNSGKLQRADARTLK